MIVYVTRFILSLVFLFYASMQDILKREVSNKVWLISVPICLILDYVDFSLGNIDLVSFFASLAASFLIGFALFYLGFYGGADAKALVLIAAANPSYLPSTALLLTKVLPLPILLTFFCSTLFTVLYPLTVLTLNLIDLMRGKHLLKGIEEKNIFKKLILYAIVRRVKLEDLEGLKRFPAEKVVIEDGKVKRKPMYYVHAEADIDKLVEGLKEHRELFEDGVLASPTIPMIVFLTIGFAFSNLVSILILI